MWPVGVKDSGTSELLICLLLFCSVLVLFRSSLWFIVPPLRSIYSWVFFREGRGRKRAVGYIVMLDMEAKFLVTQPPWLGEFLSTRPSVYTSIEDRMQLVLDATQRNIEEATGGPFGAAVFEKDSGKLVAVSVNSVIRHGWSGAHAEAMAIIFASKHIGGYDLGSHKWNRPNPSPSPPPAPPRTKTKQMHLTPSNKNMKRTKNSLSS